MLEYLIVLIIAGRTDVLYIYWIALSILYIDDLRSLCVVALLYDLLRTSGLQKSCLTERWTAFFASLSVISFLGILLYPEVH